ncbi:MAG: site-specific integrase, partial [Flavobacteriaceae bacterium]|nr:site-specific integrase [Flavobacteriaceae bacterium]
MTKKQTKRSNSNKQESAIIYSRITINSKRSEFSTGRKIELNKWNSESNQSRGNSSEIKTLNRYLDTVKAKLYDIHDKLLREAKVISASAIKDLYLGKGEKQRMLLEVFQEHNNEIKKLIGKG